MRGTDEASGSLFSFVGLEDRTPARHPLRKIRHVVNDAFLPDFGRPSIASERLIRTKNISSMREVQVSNREPRLTHSEGRIRTVSHTMQNPSVISPALPKGRVV